MAYDVNSDYFKRFWKGSKDVKGLKEEFEKSKTPKTFQAVIKQRSNASNIHLKNLNKKDAQNTEALLDKHNTLLDLRFLQVFYFITLMEGDNYSNVFKKMKTLDDFLATATVAKIKFDKMTQKNDPVLLTLGGTIFDTNNQLKIGSQHLNTGSDVYTIEEPPAQTPEINAESDTPIQDDSTPIADVTDPATVSDSDLKEEIADLKRQVSEPLDENQPAPKPKKSGSKRALDLDE
jgi:hypothetical protein